jgi:hypothetical protein
MITEAAYMKIANTIWQQIPVMTKMSIGARTPVGTETGLHFNVLRGQQTKVVIKYDAGADLYDVELIKIRIKDKGATVDIKTLGSHSGIYADQLGETLYTLTHK